MTRAALGTMQFWTMSLLLLPAALAGGGGVWQRFVSDRGGFRVEVPGKPESTVQKIATPSGPLVVHLSVVEHDRTTFAVGWSEWAETGGKTSDAAKRLDAARDGAVASAKGKLVSEKAFTLQGRPGRDLLIEGPRGPVRTRLVASERRLYQVMVMGNRKQVAGKAADRFLGSFRLEKTAGE